MPYTDSGFQCRLGKIKIFIEFLESRDIILFLIIVLCSLKIKLGYVRVADKGCLLYGKEGKIDGDSFFILLFLNRLVIVGYNPIVYSLTAVFHNPFGTCLVIYLIPGAVYVENLLL